MSERPLMKDGLGTAAVSRLAEGLARGVTLLLRTNPARQANSVRQAEATHGATNFSVDAFVKDAMRGLRDMELKLTREP